MTTELTINIRVLKDRFPPEEVDAILQRVEDAICDGSHPDDAECPVGGWLMASNVEIHDEPM